MTRRFGHDKQRADWLSDALRELPREKASPGFTGAVLNKARRDRARASGPRHMRPAWLTGPMVAIVGTTFVLALAVGLMLQQAAKHVATESEPVAESAVPTAPVLLEASDESGVERLRALRTEQERLMADLETLRRSIDEREGVIYLGGDDSVDFVVDLYALARSRVDGMRGPGVMPASTGSQGRGR